MKVRISMLGVVIVCLISIAHATTWYVHPDSVQNCIQDCLDACDVGDTVLVGPGTYYENIVWPSTQGIDLISQYGVDTTYINGGGTDCVISITIAVDTTTKISGFTIQNGFMAGVYCIYNTSPTITGNTITGNTSVDHGGGIYCELNSSPTITNNTITGNIGRWAGGIDCNHSSTPTIAGNTITDNTSFRGGGISCYYGSSPIITDNTITQNTAQWTGGGIWCTVNSSPTITGNTITDNTVTGGNEDIGGGICSVLGSSPTIDDNTISNNFANAGGGIFCHSASSPSITNNTITGNTCNMGGGGILIYEYCSATISDNTITDNTAGTGGGLCFQTASSSVTSNIITDNTADYGGGIYCTQNDSSTITGNTVTGNTANNGGGGISCKLGAAPIIEHCTIADNYGDGIYCFENGNPTIYYNDFIDNDGYAVRNMSTITVNAEYNWWGDSTGPYHPTTNPAGLGDTVSDYIDFDPWLEEAGIIEYTASCLLMLKLHVTPNPFSKLTTISFEVDSRQYEVVSIQIYDISGRLVKSFGPMPNTPCFTHLGWDGCDDSGNVLPSGVYLVRLDAGKYSKTQKILFIR